MHVGREACEEVVVRGLVEIGSLVSVGPSDALEWSGCRTRTGRARKAALQEDTLRFEHSRKP